MMKYISYRLHKSFLLIFVLVNLSTINLSSQESNGETYTEIIPGSKVEFSMQLIPETSFETPSGKKVAIDEFYIGSHEVTHDLFVMYRRKERDSRESKLMKEYDVDGITRPSPPYEDPSQGMGEDGGFPAIGMTQQNALIFCHWLYIKTGRFYRLPTEAEWIAAAIKYQPENGWFYENSDDKFHQTGTIEGESGLYDLFGNVMEWTIDNWEDEFLMSEEGSQVKNPWNVPTKKSYRVLKGGSFIDDTEEVRIWYRTKSDKKWQARDPQIPKSIWWLTDGPFVGIRLVSPVTQPNEKEIEDFFAKAVKN
jgi:formylglycine-generating enzyme required for sulfatase activity